MPSEKAPDFRSRTRRQNFLVVLKDAYEEVGVIFEWGDYVAGTEQKKTDGKGSAFDYPFRYGYCLTEKATGEVIDSAFCDEEIPLIRFLYRGRPDSMRRK